MYSYIFGVQTQVILKQVTPHEVEFPQKPLPLTQSSEATIIMN